VELESRQIVPRPTRCVIEHLSCYRGVMARHLMEKYPGAFSLLVFARQRIPACLFLEQKRTRYPCLRRAEVKVLKLVVPSSLIASIWSAHG
jgi:hypothetical protein